MKSIFRYPGGKSVSTVQKRILKYKPNDINEYREPFVGGGGIFFAMDPIQTRWINDIDKNLISVYLALRDRPEDFIAKCKQIEPEKPDEEKVSTKPGGKAIYNKRLKEVFDYFAENELCDQALRYFFVNRTVWYGRVRYGVKCQMYYSKPEGWNIVKKDLLEKAAVHLQNVKITSTNYEDLLLQPSENNVWIYCDPPYYVNTELPEKLKLYDNNFSFDDHAKFADVCKSSPHKICVSYDDRPEIWELFSDKKFNFHRESWFYGGTSSAKSIENHIYMDDNNEKVGKKVGKELIITNY
jgi:DNA adenine methylase